MKKEYLGFIRVLVGSHKYHEGSMGKELAKHQQTLGGLTVEQAVESINHFANSWQEICCLYAAVSFLKRFPMAGARLAFSPEENPCDKKPNRSAAKVVLVMADGTVSDLVTMIRDRESYGFDDLVSLNCGISLKKYCKKHLLAGEKFTILPELSGHESEDFVKFFFANPEAETYTLESFQ